MSRDDLTPEHLKTMIANATTGFGRANHLKCVKRYMANVSKLYGVSQDAFKERTCVI